MPAGSTHPMIVSCTASGAMPAAVSAPLIAAAPSCGAVVLAKTPWNAPTGVRLAARMTTDSELMCDPLVADARVYARLLLQCNVGPAVIQRRAVARPGNARWWPEV